MTGSFGLLTEDDDLAHYGDELRDRQDVERLEK